MTEPVFPVRIRSIAWEATDVFSFTLVSLDGTALPPFEPGAHIDLQLPNGLMRSYSLSNDGKADAYRITVARDPNSAGGSAYLAETARPGATIEISAPRNNFALDDDAPLSVFIAGGIGVTPFLPMMARLNERGRRWRIHYCVRTRDRAALLDEIQELGAAGAGEVVMNYDHEPGGRMLDLGAVIGELDKGDHVYCCGPTGMLDAFRAGCQAAGIPDPQVHYEYFKSNVQVATGGGYDVVLAKSGRTVRIAEGQTILEALLSIGIDVSYSCEEGVCGACETRVLAGEPDHRDLILSDQERASGRTMMICCSGARSASLMLDL